MNYYIAKIINRLKLIDKFNFSVKIKINGTTVIIPVINGLGKDNLYLSEAWMTGLLKELLPITDKGIFIDVGVNIGQTLLKLKSVDNETEYLGFEPNPNCAGYVGKLIDTNNYSNCTILPIGLYKENTVLKLNLYSNSLSDTAASLIENFRPGENIAKKIFVPVFNFKNLHSILNLKRVQIIKIDVEGAELEVLESLLNLIKRDRPVILIEILPSYNRERMDRISRQEKIEQLMKENNYSIFRIIKKDNLTIEKLIQIENIGIHDKIEWSDYVLAPMEINKKISTLNI